LSYPASDGLAGTTSAAAPDATHCPVWEGHVHLTKLGHRRPASGTREFPGQADRGVESSPCLAGFQVKAEGTIRDALPGQVVS
jgi:hypothetical protein